MGGWNFIDRTGMQFGRLTILYYKGNKLWHCKCDCGNECDINSDNLPINGKRRTTTSCGCNKRSRKTRYNGQMSICDNARKAYFLGFLAADGTISFDTINSTYSLKIVVNKTDRNILKEFKEELNSSVEIKDFHEKCSLPQGGYIDGEFSSILFCGKELVEDIISYGITPRKSLTLKVNYERIPREFWRDFWRGLFDGDGTFGEFGKRKILEVGLTTSLNMAEETQKRIWEIFPESHVSYYKRKECSGPTYNLIFTSQEDGYKFLQYIYQSPFPCLKRKYDKFLNLSFNSND